MVEIAHSNIYRKKLTIVAFIVDRFLVNMDSVRVRLNEDQTGVENFEPYSLIGDWFRYG